MTVSHTGPDGGSRKSRETGPDNSADDRGVDEAREAEPIELTDEAQLDLDDDPPLPWLQGDDDDDDDFEGAGIGQTLGFVVLGLLAIALVVGGIWFVTKRDRDEVLVADGSTIAAPKTSYKQKPDDPGGKVFAGTGDTSFGISEGQKRPARLGEDNTPPLAQPADKGASASDKPVPAETVTGVGVQVAAYSNKEQADAGWARLSGQYEALKGVKHRVVQGQADIGTVYRLQAVAPDAEAARALCGKLKASGLNCQVKN